MLPVKRLMNCATRPWGGARSIFPPPLAKRIDVAA
jgi:hypothetical protein